MIMQKLRCEKESGKKKLTVVKKVLPEVTPSSFF